jgi:flagellar protein FlbD
LAEYRDVIRLHRLGHPEEDFLLNPDLILSIESTPDTTVSLTTHSKLIVSERPEEVVAAIRAWRASIIQTALPRGNRRRSDASLSLVRATAGNPAVLPKEEEK